MISAFQTPGYEDLELSTQIIIAEALKRRVKIEILDRHDQFLRLKKNGKIEYVQSATRTSKDSYITSQILGNKLVSKKILKEHKLCVPEGKDYSDIHDAIKDYTLWSKKKCVIKPKTTNYGIGITILEKKSNYENFIKALKVAFQYDNAVLIEQFIEGIECRFLVIDKKCIAVLQRIPANIIGDGEHSIESLVKIKNQNPWRGKGHKTPLEYIEIGETEKQILAEQGLSPKSVPLKKQKIFLRKNSNISTGGDSIDYTEKVHRGFKKIAENAAKSVKAKICGVDIILKDFREKPEDENYAILELNYNPVLYFHNFPYKGKNRETGKYILDLLGFY